MTSKDKIRRALVRQEGPVPVDFGGTAVTGIHVSVVAALREHYGLPKEPVRVIEPYQMLGEVAEDLKEAMGIDTCGIYGRTTLFGFLLEGWKEWRTPWGQDVLVPGQFNVTRRGGDVYIYPEGDLSVPPSGHLPEGGYFFDTIVRQPPIDEDRLNPEDNLEEFGPVSDETALLQAHERVDPQAHNVEDVQALLRRGRATHGSLHRGGTGV